jgi:hypothetical protein
MYRAYNGQVGMALEFFLNEFYPCPVQLYGTGSVSESKAKIHPDSIVRIDWDAEKGTLSYTIDKE